ncbi:hypothetical protein HBI38_120760 [Parastagonospora nodorum]|nr:hypothetical protein HBI10_028830 [Parastagonospora nodorum]KAH4023237.1 hypothetical protein HBI13_096440 [Parastagonospora nodorum]KAH5009873.1 hypothetical protein HBI74_202050 [Parastagonospora nodorum]KAH5107818.1 hypothetical protein HBH72_040170 [Parastagonospora nodorum]KAH5220963.1 hypothetical protein HBH68_041930 [Parastagonospora nodorum]
MSISHSFLTHLPSSLPLRQPKIRCLTSLCVLNKCASGPRRDNKPGRGVALTLHPTAAGAGDGTSGIRTARRLVDGLCGSDTMDSIDVNRRGETVDFHVRMVEWSACHVLGAWECEIAHAHAHAHAHAPASFMCFRGFSREHMMRGGGLKFAVLCKGMVGFEEGWVVLWGCGRRLAMCVRLASLVGI